MIAWLLARPRLALYGLAGAAIQAALSPQAYAWTMVGAGCFVALLGFLNGRKS